MCPRGPRPPLECPILCFYTTDQTAKIHTGKAAAERPRKRRVWGPRGPQSRDRGHSEEQQALRMEEKVACAKALGQKEQVLRLTQGRDRWPSQVEGAQS